jgi:predicted DCC family thiol-disulfide oxidoreductase YuxK
LKQIEGSKITELFGVDLRSLALFRIGVAVTLILDLCQRATDLEAFYSDFGVAPRALVLNSLGSRWFVSFHFLSGVWQVQALLLVIAGLFAFALLVGYRTRLATVGCWVFLVSLDVRNFYILAGGDMLLRALVFWSMFLPLGACFSVDHAWSRDGSPPKRIFSWGTFAYSTQIVVLYIFSGLGKSGAEWWGEGSAIYYALNVDYVATGFGQWLLQLSPRFLQYATWATLAYEFLGPMSLFSPVLTGPIRTLAIFGFIGLHLMILMSLLVGIFPFVGIVSILFFLPSWFWDRLVPEFRSLTKRSLTIYYDGDCGFCLKGIQLIKEFLLASTVHSIPAQSIPDVELEMRRANSWIVVDESGRHYLGFHGMIAVFNASKVLSWTTRILRLAPMKHFAEKVFHFVADHGDVNYEISRVSNARDLIRLQLSTCGSVVAVFFTCYMILWNVANLKYMNVKIPERVRSVGNLVGLDQIWEMFAPFPAKDDGWYVIPGTLKDGRQVDLYRKGAPIDWRKPVSIAQTIKNDRWRKYFELLNKRDFLPPGYARYLCRTWNRSHAGNDALEELDIVFMVEWTRPDFEYFEPRKMPIIKYSCSEGPKSSTAL